jgi:CHAD domain-containing protein
MKPAARSEAGSGAPAWYTSGKAEGAKLTTESAAGDVVLAHVREQVEQVRSQDLPVRLDAPDAIHKMRVATWRLRSALTTFKPLFAADVVRPLRGELEWLAGELGAARDAEVMRDRVRWAVEAEKTVVDLGPVAEVAGGELGEAYRGAHDRVLAELDGDRYHGLLTRLDELVTSPPVTERAAARAGKTLPRLVARSYSGVHRLVEDAAAHAAGAEREELLHDARKAAKAARYAGESVSRVFGADATAFAQAMEAVQEVVGVSSNRSRNAHRPPARVPRHGLHADGLTMGRARHTILVDATWRQGRPPYRPRDPYLEPWIRDEL